MLGTLLDLYQLEAKLGDDLQNLDFGWANCRIPGRFGNAVDDLLVAIRGLIAGSSWLKDSRCGSPWASVAAFAGIPEEAPVAPIV